MLFSNENVDK